MESAEERNNFIDSWDQGRVYGRALERFTDKIAAIRDMEAESDEMVARRKAVEKRLGLERSAHRPRPEVIMKHLRDLGAIDRELEQHCAKDPAAWARTSAEFHEGMADALVELYAEVAERCVARERHTAQETKESNDGA